MRRSVIFVFGSTQKDLDKLEELRKKICGRFGDVNNDINFRCIKANIHSGWSYLSMTYEPGRLVYLGWNSTFAGGLPNYAHLYHPPVTESDVIDFRLPREVWVDRVLGIGETLLRGIPNPGKEPVSKPRFPISKHFSKPLPLP